MTYSYQWICVLLIMSILEKTTQDLMFLQNMTNHVLDEIKKSVEQK
jgi:hypothetical protein